MTANTVAKAHWRALDRAGEDTCSLSRLDFGWMLVGHARYQDGPVWSALDYVIRCDTGWLTTSADITGMHGDTEVALNITRRGQDWTLNDMHQPQVFGAVDIDLGFTPATNLMPLRRLPEVGSINARAAWLPSPLSALQPLNQRYTRERGNLVHYHADQTGFQTHLKVAPSGFVLFYPGFWDSDLAS